VIRYALNCAHGHTFDSWFPSSESFEAQKARGLVACPTCGTVEVEKAIMAPAVSRTDRDRSAPAAAPADATPTPVALMSEEEQTFRRMLRELREHVTKTADYVGDEFADLARQMHDGDLEHRSIYGEATAEDIKALRDDEVDVFPLPILPDERN